MTEYNLFRDPKTLTDEELDEQIGRVNRAIFREIELWRDELERRGN